MDASETVIVALGGNALQDPAGDGTYDQQTETVTGTASILVDLIDSPNDIILTHGNGPQIGSLLRQNVEAADVTPPMPLYANGAQTQGLIGFMIQAALLSHLNHRGLNVHVAPVVTPVRVNRDDPAFENPTKPIGPFLTESEATQLQEDQDLEFNHYPDDGYRQVVPSPEPREVYGMDTVKDIITGGDVPIVAGGGGVPVVETDDGTYTGVNAVIDKDLTGAVLGTQLDADVFVILTNVSNVALNYGDPDQVDLDRVTVETAREYMDAGHFYRGSMYEKVEAACRFVEGDSDRRAVIAALDAADAALAGTAGTQIVADD